jgi:hypothetical protein
MKQGEKRKERLRTYRDVGGLQHEGFPGSIVVAEM